MSITPYQHREATATVAQAWSTLEDRQNDPGRADAARLLRDALAVIDPPATPQRASDAAKGTSVPVESDRGEWWPTASLAAEAIGVSRPAVSVAMADPRRTCAGRHLWRSAHASRAAFEAARTGEAERGTA